MHQAGVRMSLSVDHITTYDANLFDSMRFLATVVQHKHGNNFKLSSKMLVEMATIGGARDLGFGDKVGSLTPGKRADMILVRTDDLNTAPFGNPAILLVQQAQPVNVDTVVIDGRILKHKGKLTAIDAEEVIRKAVESFAAVRKRAGGPY